MDTLLIVGIVITILATVYLRVRVANPKNKGRLEADIDKGAARYVKDNGSPALVIGVHKNGKSFIKGYGSTQGDGLVKPDEKSVFQIGSLTKLFTASTLQLLADDDVLGMENTLEGSIGNAVALCDAVCDVTMRQLSTHTSGFARIPEPLMKEAIASADVSDVMLDPYSHLGRERILAYLDEAHDKRTAGNFEYSNYGMGLLGHVMEIVTGSEYEPLVKKMLLNPLGMQNTTITLTEEQRARLAQGHDAKGQPVPIWTFAALGGAGAFASTADDMMTFVAQNLTGDGSVAESLQSVHSSQHGDQPYIGWMPPTFLDRLFGNRTVLWHNGMVGGYASYLSIDTRNGTGVVALSSQALELSMLGTMLTRQVRTQSWEL